MKKISLPKVNCFTLSNCSTVNPGIRISPILGANRGVILSSAVRAGIPARPDLIDAKENTVTVAAIDARGCIGTWSGQPEILIFATGVYEVEHLHGAVSTEVSFWDGSLRLGGSDGPACRGRNPAPALLRLSWAPRDGHFHEAPAVRLRRRGGESVIGLSSVERLKNGWPIPWCRTRREYDRVMSESARQLDETFLRHGLARRLLE